MKNECLIFPPKRANINPEIKPLQKFLDFDYHKIYQANGLDELFFQIAINKGISILPKGTLQGRAFDFKTLPIRDIEDKVMSMDLERKIYSTAPEHFIAGTDIGIAKATKKASAAVEAHAPVLLADGKVKP